VRPNSIQRKPGKIELFHKFVLHPPFFSLDSRWIWALSFAGELVLLLTVRGKLGGF
jgi:hypothetical protein